MKQDLVLVVGGSGSVGSEIVRILKSQGHSVRVTTSKPVDKSQNEKVQVNLATGEGLHQAFEGVTHAFLISPPGYADQYSMLSPLIQEAKRRALKKTVLMTAMGANAVETTPFRRAELELEKSGLQYNIIRPNWFFENFNTYWVHGINTENKILLPAGKAKTSFIDVKDVAAVAAQLLMSDKMNQKDFDLTGPQAVDHDEIASTISEKVGRKITYQEIAPETLKKTLVGAGLPEDYVNFMLLIFSFLKEGYNAAVNTNVKTILGREPKSLKQYVEEHLSAWQVRS